MDNFKIEYVDYSINAESGFQEYTGFQIYNDDVSTRPKFNVIYICLPLIMAILITIFSLRYHKKKRLNEKTLENSRRYEQIFKHPQL